MRMLLLGTLVLAGCSTNGSCAGSKELPRLDPTIPPHCAGETPDCATFGYLTGATRCSPEGDIDLAPCAGTASVFGGDVAASRARGTCGNGKIDGWVDRVCAPCVAGTVNCPCSDIEYRDACDGRDLGGKTCEGLGYLGGRLACTKVCGLDKSGCTVVAPELPQVRIGSVAGLSGAFDFPGALGATKEGVAVAWTMPREGMKRDIVFAWSDPLLRVLRSAPRFDGGNVAELRLAGNERGWLLGVSTYGDNPGPNGPGIAVYPVSTHGHVGKPGAAVARNKLLFLERGAPGEPSLVGAQGSAQKGSTYYWTLDAWLVDDQGAPRTPFQIGTPILTYSTQWAQARYFDGKFYVARGSTRDPAIEISVVALDGTVTTLPAAHADFAGSPFDLAVTRDRIVVAFTKSETAATWKAAFGHDGTLVEAPAIAAEERGVAWLGPAGDPALLTASGKVWPASGAARRLLGGAGLFVPVVAATDGGTYAIAISEQTASVVKLR